MWYAKPVRRSLLRRAGGRLFRGVFSLWKRRPVRRALWACVGIVAGINFAVSALGQSGGFVLSPYHLWDKTRALGYLAAHQVRQIGEPKMPAPHRVIRRAAAKYKVPAKLALAVARAESGFISTRISATGAMGVMQLMPDTALLMGVSDPFHVAHNVNGGVRYLAGLWRRYRGDMRRTVAAYNVGPGNIPRTGGYRVPPETAAYVNAVIRYSRLY